MNKLQPPEHPVFFDSRYSFEIYSHGGEEPFPFQVGDTVEVKGFLMYHDLQGWVRQELLPDARWNATIYPLGEIVSDDSMALDIRGVSREIDFELVWVADKDANLLLVSNELPPSDLFLEPRAGDTRDVCLRMTVERAEQDVEDGERTVWLVMRPVGEKTGLLIHSNIRLCEQY